jgi:hypothetical protein
LNELTEYVLLHQHFSDLLFASTDISNGADAVSTVDANGAAAVSTVDANGASAVSTDIVSGAAAVSTDIANGTAAVSTAVVSGTAAVSSTAVVGGADAVSSTAVVSGTDAVSSTAVVSGADAVSSTAVVSGADAVSTDDVSGIDAVSSTAVVSGADAVSSSTAVVSGTDGLSSTITLPCSAAFYGAEPHNYHILDAYHASYICTLTAVNDDDKYCIQYKAQFVHPTSGATIRTIVWDSNQCYMHGNPINHDRSIYLASYSQLNRYNPIQFETSADLKRVLEFAPQCSTVMYKRMMQLHRDNTSISKLYVEDAERYGTVIAVQQKQIMMLRETIDKLTHEKTAASEKIAALLDAATWRKEYYRVAYNTTLQTTIDILKVQITALSTEQDKLTDVNTKLSSQLADLSGNYETALYCCDKYRKEYFDSTVQLAKETNAKATLFEELESTKALCAELTDDNETLQSQLTEQHSIVTIIDCIKRRLYMELKHQQDIYTALAEKYQAHVTESTENAKLYAEYVRLHELTP